MKKIILFFASFIAVYIPVAQAEDSPHEFSANVAYTTDYVFRGVTQTDSGAASIYFSALWASKCCLGFAENFDSRSIHAESLLVIVIA